MERMPIDGVELEYEVTGSGPPVLMIHGSHVADSMVPLATQPVLADGYQLIRCHRRGFAGSTHPDSPVSIGDQAADAAALLDQLGAGPAHLVGHSYGAAVALQLALDRPELTRSLALLEPALLNVPATEAMLPKLQQMGERYASGDSAGAVGDFLEFISGRSNWRQLVDASVPGGVDQAVKDARTFYEIEIPALQTWSFGAEEAARIDKPVLSVLGTDSIPLFHEGRALTKELFPNAELCDLQGVAHLLQMEGSSAELAGAMADFFARN